jgi:hypothetical protein
VQRLLLLLLLLLLGLAIVAAGVVKWPVVTPAPCSGPFKTRKLVPTLDPAAPIFNYILIIPPLVAFSRTRCPRRNGSIVAP